MVHSTVSRCYEDNSSKMREVMRHEGVCYFREGGQGSRVSQRPEWNEDEKSLPKRCLSKCEITEVRGKNGKKIGVAGTQRSRGRVLGTDVEEVARVQIMKDFGGHDKNSLFFFQGNEKPWRFVGRRVSFGLF